MKKHRKLITGFASAAIMSGGLLAQTPQQKNSPPTHLIENLASTFQLPTSQVQDIFLKHRNHQQEG